MTIPRNGGFAVEPVTVLEYAPPRLQSARRIVLRRLARAIVCIVVVALGAAVGYALTPEVRLATQYYQLNSNALGPGTLRQAFMTSIASHLAGLQSPATFDAVLAELQTKGFKVPPGQPGHAFLREGLTVRAVPNSVVVEITFRSPDSPLAFAASNAFTNVALKQKVNGMWPVPLGMSASTTRDPWGAAVGATIGICAVLVWVFWSRAFRRSLA